MSGFPDRYSGDVLARGRSDPRRPASTPVVVELDLVVEDAATGFTGAVVGWENGLVVLADRKDKRRSFPFGKGFWIEGKPVELQPPTRKRTGKAAMSSASGSRASAPAAAKVALPSRIYVEGRHDAELVEKIWGDDLRHVGVVVEFLGGIDDLPAIVAEFAPTTGRRLGVLVDHLVPGSKESRIAEQVTRDDHVMITGHRYLDIWQAVKPAAVGIEAWPSVPRGEDLKTGTCARLGWPHRDQTDTARAWQHILSRVGSWTDLDHGLVVEMEKLIDFVTADHLDTLEP